MRLKKFLALLTALALAAVLLPGQALAAENDGFIVVNTEQELNSALNKGTEKIKLGKDISSKTFENGFALKTKVVIDLDGHTWTDSKGLSDYLRIQDGADVTVQNGTAAFTIRQNGGDLTLTGLELNGRVYCNSGKLVSMEDCTLNGDNGDNYPCGVYVGEDGTVGKIKDCTIVIGKRGERGISCSGSIDTVENCTIVIGSNSVASRGFHIDGSGTVGAIKDCTITGTDDLERGIYVAENAVVDLVENCIITANIAIYCTDESKIKQVANCTLNAKYVCFSLRSSIDIITGNTMTATGTYGKGIELSGTVGTVSNNTIQTPLTSLHLHTDAKAETVINNTSNAYLYSDGEIGTISGNTITEKDNYAIVNRGTIALLGENNLSGNPEAVSNKGTIKETSASSPVDSMDQSAWYYEAMTYAYSNGLTMGIPDDVFQPNDKLTRAMLAQMLWNLEDRPASDGGAFTDVASGAWYESSVNWAADKEIVGGYGDGLFGPTDNITREQVATILYRYVKNSGGEVSGKADLSGYADASRISAYALEAMQWANAEKLITGTTDTTLSPKGNTTCAEMAAIVMRLMGK